MHALNYLKLSVAGCLLFGLTVAARTQTVVTVPEASGRPYVSSEMKRHKATVFVFLATDCPNSNSYAPELIRLSKEYGDRGVAFYSVYSDSAETAAGVQKHDSDYRIPFPALMDSRQILAHQTGAMETPEAIVLSSDGKALYRGRIDDRFANYGRTRLHVDQHDLREALDDILAGTMVAHPYEPSLGCAIPGIAK
jgi:thiol-disulfide isomerase/thioredoxin